MNFDGATYNPEYDEKRLASLLERVKTLMADGTWRTLKEINLAVGGTESSVSARLRDLRKDKFGGYQVERRHRGSPSEGLYEYRLISQAVLNVVFDASGQAAFL